MTKKEKLVKLDTQVLDSMIDILSSKDEAKIAGLSDLTPAINYLRNNAVVADKEKSTVEKDTEERLKLAQARRAKNESE